MTGIIYNLIYKLKYIKIETLISYTFIIFVVLSLFIVLYYNVLNLKLKLDKILLNHLYYYVTDLDKAEYQV